MILEIVCAENIPTAKKLGRATERPHGNSEGKGDGFDVVDQMC